MGEMNECWNVRTDPVTPDQTRKWFEPVSACFAAGTLVHTQTGLVPIEQIKVGDMVLSKPESGEGEQAYKRVTRTFAHEPQTVMAVGYTQPDDVNKGGDD
jgi:hypothetical protein